MGRRTSDGEEDGEGDPEGRGRSREGTGETRASRGRGGGQAMAMRTAKAIPRGKGGERRAMGGQGAHERKQKTSDGVRDGDGDPEGQRR